MVQIILKDVLKFAIVRNGELSVITPGVQMMVLLLVVNWDFHMCQSPPMHIMDKEEDKSGWRIYHVQDQSLN